MGNNGYGSYGSNNSKKPRSKYLRDPNEKTSKYLRDKNDAPKSKYRRDSNQKREHHYNLARNYREEEEIVEELTEEALEEAQTAENEAVENENVEITEAENETAETIIEDESSEEVISEEVIDSEESFENAEKSDENELESVEEFQNRVNGDNKERYSSEVSNLFTHSKLSRETTVAHVEDDDEARRKVIIMTIVVLAVLTAAACLIQYAQVKIPYFPRMLSIDFSAFPELIASLAYGPVFGILITIVKNILYMFASNSVSYGSILSNVILDSIFVTTGGWFYSRRMFSVNPKKNKKPVNKDLRKRRIIMGGIISTIITTFVSFFLTRFVSYPLIIKQFASNGVNDGLILKQYQDSLNLINSSHPELFSSAIPKIDSLTSAILIYNMPVTLLKYLLIAVVAAIVYPIISPYIHFRKNTK